ncbi:brefeldin A-inhibited guanine nucleotide-exchange protein 3 isoform X1 [Pieris brassicae]|uniref:brefeldin A-inhibited guanine nucleotide-exchange protein 3 isoform X1 n=2 Tax=Pieris brassicae TaxID=7116 RepID=UPI001E65FA37|nr:brefeldin A-inhibited guanine nucleotide-exchange protein 3 isoform X1 [Pieris brassicae]XP_045513114.1 brefeldin A-inhibited guanine nucleotide-exchange protein 3 isoform X1 [Pieris brassicae]XP_045513122.1 brefeldin A-inhibited guanine nucleotide-exchange protein 3 isoform X1 [Pieris brassicae]
MEELLQDILKEASGPKLNSLKKSCQEALELICAQDVSGRRPSYECRRACLQPLQLALETKRPRLVAFALQGFHKILRDDRFHRGIEPEDDSLWTPSQLLCATSSVMYQLPDTQVQIFRMYLSLALSPRRTLNGRLSVWACGRCAEAASSAPHVAAAARAAAAQVLRAYCAQLDEECQELLSEGSPVGQNHLVAVGCYSEVIPVIQYLCSRLTETQMIPKQNPLALFFLDCLLTLMSSLSERVSGNSHFTTFLWQKFCPSLISFLGTPRVDKNIKSREHEGSLVDDSGRGSGALVCAPSFNSKQAKAIYSIANQLVRLVGSTSNLRPVLEALYHRMLLYPPIQHRVEPLRSVRELLQHPKRLTQLVLIKRDDRHSDDMAIVRLIMDGIEECGRSGNPEVVAAAVECVVSLLDALEKLCTTPTDYITPETASLILDHWPKLHEADYTGPLTYQTLARLPSPYRDVVADLQSKEAKDNDSSDTSGPENLSSGSEAEVDSDADNVFLPSRASNPTYKEDNFSETKAVPKTLNLGRCTITECNVDLERHNARQFVKTLQNSLLPKLVTLRTCIEVDEAMQEFASKCCQHNAAQPPATACIMNADGVYLATYAALLLTLKQKRSKYYADISKIPLPLTEDEFVEDVQGSGLLVYLSATWLRELYQQVVATDLLKDVQTSDHPLIHLLSDLGGLDSNPVMSDWQRLKEVSMVYHSSNDSPQLQASLRWARRVLTCIWESMVTVLSVPLIGCNKKHKLHGIITKKINTFGKRKRIAWEGLTIQCLEGLHKAARISTTLSLQNRCNSILALLASSATSQPANGKILSTHALSLDILISGGLELGSKAPECWEHIFAACQYVSSFEHSLFGQQGNNATPIIAMQTGRNKTVSILQADAKLGLDGRDDETCVDVFNFLQPIFDTNNANNEMSVAKIVENCRQEGGNVISGSNAARVCCALTAAADTLYTRLAATTTLPTLRSALQRLVSHHHRLLFCSWDQDVVNNNWWRRGTRVGHGAGEAARALCRAGDVALRCLRAARPLAHRMAIWTVVGPHFMQAACHKDIQISSLAIQCLHDCATTLLNQQVELPHFHFNEALLKPFENLLCLELCDDDIQEQIISCICEFVETNRMEIRSGWRPLFNTLRAANNSNQYSAILEIFKVFLNTDNTLVFANAALDCILCLLSHIKGLHYEDPQTEVKPKKPMTPTQPKPSLSLKFSKNSKFIPLSEEKTEKVIVDMCKEALYHLENCADILTMMYNMPKCPIFNTGNRIKGDLPLSVVDPIIPSGSLDVTKYISNDNCNEELISYRKLSTTLPPSNTTNNCLLKLDKPSNILKVWYVLIEGLISATVVCSKKNQPAAMESLFKLLRNIADVPGTHFGLHCINHLLLPTVQNWLRQIANVNTHWDSIMPNFKQCCGMTTDTVVFYLHNLQQINIERPDGKNDKKHETFESPEITFALKQIMLILVECIAQAQEPIARLGASCIRHIILTSGHLLTDNQWEVICTSLHRACNVSLSPLKQLTYAFKENSNSFYGDLAIVKVAARRDCSVNDNVRLHAMAQQVFLTEQLRGESNLKQPSKNSNQILIDDRSYIFLIYLQEAMNCLNPDLYTVRIPNRGLVVGLLAHQILIQIIATVLIQASSDVFQGINGILLESLKSGTNICNYQFFLTKNNTDLLLKSLELSYTRAMQFDSRPGLKFLVQKVSNLDYAANLYKQTSSSWLIKIIALTDIFFNGVARFKLKSNDLSIILKNYTSSLNMTLEYDQFVMKIFDLKSTWELLCSSYLKHLINVSDFEEEEDNIKERISVSSVDSDSSNHYEEFYYQNSEKQEPNNKEDLDVQDDIEKLKPFTFADFKEANIESDTDKVSNFQKNDNIENDDVNYDDSPTKDDPKKVIRYTDVSPEKAKTNSDVEVDKGRTVNITINDAPILEKNKNIEVILPPQPVPPEIEQQRAISISKDMEVQRNCFLNVLMAYLELVLSFPLERFHLIYPVLQTGFVQLARTVNDPQLLDRINVFFDKKDLVG